MKTRKKPLHINTNLHPPPSPLLARLTPSIISNATESEHGRRQSVHYKFLSKIKPVYLLRTRSYSRSITKKPFIVNYQGAQFRVYPGRYQCLLDTGSRYKMVSGTSLHLSHSTLLWRTGGEGRGVSTNIQSTVNVNVCKWSLAKSRSVVGDRFLCLQVSVRAGYFRQQAILNFSLPPFGRARGNPCAKASFFTCSP